MNFPAPRTQTPSITVHRTVRRAVRRAVPARAAFRRTHGGQLLMSNHPHGSMAVVAFKSASGASSVSVSGVSQWLERDGI